MIKSFTGRAWNSDAGHLLAVLSLLFVFVLSGCASTGAYNASSTTETELSKANYEIVERDVKGEASAGYVFGVSRPRYQAVETFALARVTGSENLYGDALQDLWSSFEQRDGDVEGRPLALVNVRYDIDPLNLFVYTRSTLTVRADVVEFQE